MRLPLILAAAAALIAGPALAHHSVYGAFDKDHPQEVRGVMKEVRWINPHIIMIADIEDGRGGHREMRIEGHPVTFLRRVGVTQEMLMAGGKPISMTILPARKEGVTDFGFMVKLTTPEGKTIQFTPDR